MKYPLPGKQKKSKGKPTAKQKAKATLVLRELYPGDAQWSGLYDRMFPHTAEEMERRLTLAADYGEPSPLQGFDSYQRNPRNLRITSSTK